MNNLVDLAGVGLLGFGLAPQTITSDTTTTGPALDMQLADGSIHMVVITGDNGDASTAYTVKLTESDTSGGSYTDVVGASLTFTASATANDNLVRVASTLKWTKRYIKAVVVTSGGGTPSVKIAVAVLGRKKVTGTGGGAYTTVT